MLQINNKTETNKQSHPKQESFSLNEKINRFVYIMFICVLCILSISALAG